MPLHSGVLVFRLHQEKKSSRRVATRLLRPRNTTPQPPSRRAMRACVDSLVCSREYTVRTEHQRASHIFIKYGNSILKKVKLVIAYRVS